MSSDTSLLLEKSSSPAPPFECALMFHTLERGESLLGISPEKLLEFVGLDALLRLAQAVKRSRDVLETTDQRLAVVQGAVWSALRTAVPLPIGE